MPRKLKVYQTSQGFYDLAIAAPSMKAALEAWGAASNLFHQGFAKEADEPGVIAAAMAHPGVVLQRPVGSSAAFREHSGLPTKESLGAPAPRGEGRANKKKTEAKPRKPSVSPKRDEKAERRAAAAFEKERERRERERRKEEAAAAKVREAREAAKAKAEAALEKARQEHERRAEEISAAREAILRRETEEDERWEKLRKRLEDDLREAKY
jgi:colicin import membrane protein